MPSRSQKVETLNIGVQAAAGTAATTLYRMSEVSVTPGVRGQVDVFEAANKRIPSDLDVSAEWSETAFDSRVFFDPMAFILAAAFGAPVTTPLAGSGAFKHVWTIRDDTFPTRKLLTVRKGNTTDAEQTIDNFTNQLGWAVERLGAYAFTGRFIGQALARQAIGAGTTLTRARALARKTGFYFSNSLGSLATAMGADVNPITYGTPWPGDVFGFNFTTADMSHPKWTLNPTSAVWDDYIEDSITPVIEVQAEANTMAMDNTAATSFLYAMRNNAIRYIGGKVMSIVPAVATDHYMFKWEAATQINVENMDQEKFGGRIVPLALPGH